MSVATAVSLFLGGHASEHAISLLSGQAMARGLLDLGIIVHPVVLGVDGTVSLLAPWTRSRDVGLSDRVLPGAVPDAVFSGSLLAVASRLRASGLTDVVLALHGPLGEDGRLQGFLELGGFRFTGSGATASAVCADKALTKRVTSSYGLATPNWTEVSREEFAVGIPEIAVPLPYVVKPRNLGSSVGISIVREADGLRGALRLALEADSRALVESFVAGRELTCAVIPSATGPLALPVIEIVPRKAAWFDYASKYDTAGADEIVPARIPESLAQRVQGAALTAHRALGCSGITRTDFLADDQGVPWLLEVNTTPGMTDMSLVPKAARAVGLNMANLMEALWSDVERS